MNTEYVRFLDWAETNNAPCIAHALRSILAEAGQPIAQGRDMEMAAVRHKSYWEGYDRGKADGVAGGYIMPPPLFPEQPKAAHSGDYETMAMSAMAKAQENAANRPQQGFNGYQESNWNWPGDVVETTTYSDVLTEEQLGVLDEWRERTVAGWKITEEDAALVSKASLVEVSPEPAPVYHRSKYGDLFKVWASGDEERYVPLPKHRFIYLSGQTRLEAACL